MYTRKLMIGWVLLKEVFAFTVLHCLGHPLTSAFYTTAVARQLSHITKESFFYAALQSGSLHSSLETAQKYPSSQLSQKRERGETFLAK